MTDQEEYIKELEKEIAQLKSQLAETREFVRQWIMTETSDYHNHVNGKFSQIQKK